LIYLDTSVLVAYYCPEPRSREAERIVRAEIGPVISDLTEVELFAAVGRKARASELGPDDAAQLVAELRAHLDGDFYRRVALEHRHFAMAREWLSRFTAHLRTLDALHLAVTASEGLSLATFDRGLARAAQSLGVRVARDR
jgi:predicted nucleic acid-binding protein